MTRRNSRFVAGTVALVAFAALIAIYAQRPATPVVTSLPTASPTATSVPQTASPSSTVAASPQVGAITGRFGYPSDFIPPVIVYAISTTDARVWYSVAFAGFGNPPRPSLPPGASQATYTITGVAPGTYWVVAYRTDGQLPDPGYYSHQPDCFRATQSGPCSDISLMVATVIAGQTTSGIDV